MSVIHNKPFRIAVVGCGAMANTWVKYARSRQDTEIVALIDIKEENARAMADRYNLSCRIYSDLKEAVESTGANLVFDITIPEVHKNVTTTALSLGCHVFGEKPMAASIADARDMIEASRSSGKQYAVMQNRRYIKNIRALRDLLSSGTIGTPGFMTANFFLGPHFGGFRDAMDSPLILDMAIHTFDQARFISGADPISVYCHEFNPPGSWYKGNAAAVCIFEMSNGVMFTYNGSWCTEGAQTSWEAEWRVTGSLGSAIWDGSSSPYAEIVAHPEETAKFTRESRRVEPTFNWSGAEGHYGCLDEMFHALVENRNAETVCTDNIKSMSMVLGALESAKFGRKVML